mgnify:CR=1 FL=1
MPPRKKKVESTEEPVIKSRGLFNHVNAIYQDQSANYWSTLTDGDKKTYSPYMINRFLSMNIHQIPVVNAIQQFSQVPAEQHYLFYANMIPRGRQFNKYIKSRAEEKYEPWVVELVARHFLISQAEAVQYLDIYYTHDKAALLDLCKSYGYGDKELKKL